MNLRSSPEYYNFLKTDYTNSIGVRLLMADIDNWDNPNQDQHVKNIQYRAEKIDLAIKFLVQDLINLPEDATIEQIQTIFYDTAKKCYGDNKNSIRDFFSDLYCVTFDKMSGPRWGVFVSLYGVQNYCMLIINKVNDIHKV